MLFVLAAVTVGSVCVLAENQATYVSDIGNPQQCIECSARMYKDCENFKVDADIQWCAQYKCWEECGDPVDEREVTVICDTCVENCSDGDDHQCIYHSCGGCYDVIYEFRSVVANTVSQNPGVVTGVAVAAVLAVFALVWKLGFSKSSVTETRDGSFQAL